MDSSSNNDSFSSPQHPLVQPSADMDSNNDTLPPSAYMDSNNDTQPSADMDSNNDSLPSPQQSLVQPSADMDSNNDTLPPSAYMDSNNDTQPSANMDSNNDSLPSPQQSLERMWCVSYLAQLQEYDIEFLSVLANFLWMEGKEGWPLEPFEIKEQYFEKSLLLAKKISEEFYLLAATETKILSNKKGDFGDYKICAAKNWVRGEILSLRKLVEDHFTVSISEYMCHRKMFEDLVEEMLKENKFSTETLFTCWTHWKNNIRLVLSSLDSYEAGDPNEHVKFAINYLGVRKVNDNWFLLFPELSWMKQVAVDSLTAHGSWMLAIKLADLISFARRYWLKELVSVGDCVLIALGMFYRSDDDEIPKAHRFAAFLHIWDVVDLLKQVGLLRISRMAYIRLENYTNRLIADYLEQISPVGWNAEMNKDIVMLRKSQVCGYIVKHSICDELNRDLNDLNYGQLTKFLVMMFGAPKLDDEVYMSISLKLEDKNPWRAFIESLRSDTEEGEELNQFWLFYGAMENTIQIERASSISPINLLYLIDRFLLWTSLLKDGIIYATKSTMTEWLIQNDKESVKRLNCMTHQTNLEGVHAYIGNLLLQLSRQDSSETKQWTSRHNDGISAVMFVHRIFVAACMLHLTSRNHFGLLVAMLSNGNLTYYLHPKFWSYLAQGRTNNNIDVKVVARALRFIKNPLVIAKLRDGSLDIVCLAKAKDEMKLSMDPERFWDWLDSLVKDPNKLLDNSIMESFLKSCIVLVTASLENPLSLESQDEMRELENLLDEMKDLLHPISLSTEELIKFLKRMLSRKTKVGHILNHMFLMGQRDAASSSH